MSGFHFGSSVIMPVLSCWHYFRHDRYVHLEYFLGIMHGNECAMLETSVSCGLGILCSS